MEEKQNFLKNSQIIILGLCIALATIASSVIISKGMMKIKKFSTEVIGVTGSSERKITSDYITWSSEFSRRDLDMTVAFKQLQEDLKTVKEYLMTSGIKESEITVNQVDITTLYKKTERNEETNIIEGYRLTQGIKVKSEDVQKITDISRRSTELINQGIKLVSESPSYFYMKLPELKHEMLQEATLDAKKRAERIASATDNKIGVIRSAKMGVFQITPINSFEVSDWGENDTTSFEKRAHAVVKADFSIV